MLAGRPARRLPPPLPARARRPTSRSTSPASSPTASADDDLAFQVEKGDETVGVVLIRRDGDVARVLLDYVTPRYRDFSPGEFVWRRHPAAARARLPQGASRPPGMVAPYYDRLAARLPARGRDVRAGPLGGCGAPRPSGRGSPARPPGVDRLAGLGRAPRPAPRRRAAPGASWTASAAPALSSTASRTAPGSPSSSAAYDLGVVGGVAAAQRLRGRQRRARSRSGRRSPRVTSPPWTVHTDDVVVVVSSSSPSSPRNTHASTPARGEDAGHHRRHPAVGAADRLGGGPGRVGQRAEEVERGADAELAPGHGGVPHRGVEGGGEAEGDAGLARPARRPGRRAGRAGCPSASSTSAEPDCDDAERLPCLTTRAPAPAATIAAIVEMLTDIDRSPPVPTTSSSRPGTEIGVGAGVHRLDEAGASPRWSRPWRAARRRSRRSATGVASPARISPIAQAVWSAVRSLPRDQGGEHVGPGGRRHAVDQAVAGTRERSSATTASASWTGSIGCGHRGLGARPGRQPGVLRAAGQHQRPAGTGRSRP